MAKGQLYEYAVILHPKPSKNGDGTMTNPKSEIITDVTRLLAGNEKEVSVLAARSIPEKYLDRLDELDIIVRPF